MWMSTETSQSRSPHDQCWRTERDVTAFKISPDGTRMALVRRTENGAGARARTDHPFRQGQDHG